MRVKNITSLVSDIIEVPYKLGGFTPEEGFDCFSFLYYFYDKLGFNIPPLDDLGYGINRDNYVELYEANPKRMLRIMFRVICKLTTSGKLNYLEVPDTLIYKSNGGDSSGIYIGQSNILVLDVNLGICVIPRKHLKMDGVLIRRWSQK